MISTSSPARSAVCFALLALALGIATGCAPTAPTSVADLSAEERDLLLRVWAEEDSRPAAAAATALRAGMGSETALIRRYAVRAMGRLENLEAVPMIAPLLGDADPSVRAAAANAVAQSAFNGPSADAERLLHNALASSTHPVVVGALTQALGRLRPSSPDYLATTETLLLRHTRDAPTAALLTTLRGIEWLARANRAALEFDGSTVERVVELTRYERGDAGGNDESAANGTAPTAEQLRSGASVRRLALAALAAAAALDVGTLETALSDADIEVRRVAANAIGAIDDAAQLPVLIGIAMADDHAMVRYEGLRWYARRLQPSAGCGAVIAALQDPGVHVQLLAIDSLGAPCGAVGGNSDGGDGDGDGDIVTTTLSALAEATPGLPTTAEVGSGGDTTAPATPSANHPDAADGPGVASSATWHHGAHALVSLARADPDSAVALLPRFAPHPVWQVRMYAANAAAITGSVDALQRLSGDPHANVAAAALGGLAQHAGAGAASAAIAALRRDDYQLLMIAANALESSRDAAAVPALLEALQRVSAQQRETSRDPRMAILERIGALGDETNGASLRPYVDDFDPRIAEKAAEIITSWTGVAVTAAPQPLPPTPFPTMDELIELSRTRAVFEMRDGGFFVVALHPFAAPTNVARFARQARGGYFEGLTFHRVVANFVVQGGSPGANEYVGDGPYSRDEVGVESHLRGTVGISTRGRDTGDSQLFVNLVDNVRLDHNYTLIGAVIEGMAAVDDALEGAVIERVILEPIESTQN